MKANASRTKVMISSHNSDPSRRSAKRSEELMSVGWSR